VHRAVCLLTPKLLLVLIVPNHREMARLGWHPTCKYYPLLSVDASRSLYWYDTWWHGGSLHTTTSSQIHPSSTSENRLQFDSACQQPSTPFDNDDNACQLWAMTAAVKWWRIFYSSVLCLTCNLIVCALHSDRGFNNKLTCVAGYIPRLFTPLQTVTHPSTNWAQHSLTSLMRPTTLPTTPNLEL